MGLNGQMRSSLPVLAMAVLLAAAPAAQARSCADPASKTVRKNGMARVFQKGPFGAERLRGCLYSRGIERSVLLAKNYDDQIYESATWDGVRLYRRFVAWRYTRTDSSCKAQCPPGYGYWETLRVRDLATGAARRRPPDFELGASFAITTTRVIVTAVARDGAVELATWDGEAAGVLDSGDIDPASLRASGDRVVWRNAGVRRSARI
jgi:hypothetical protein